MNFLRHVLTRHENEDLVVIPSGEFYLRRAAASPKSAKECIFKDAVAAIRKTTIERNYQLVIQRVYEEGEEDLDADASADGSAGASSLDLDAQLNDEWAFLLDEALELRYESRDDHIVIIWKDVDSSDDETSWFEYVCDSSIKPRVFDKFDLEARKCQYERKYSQAWKGDVALLDEFEPKPEPEPEPESKSLKDAHVVKGSGEDSVDSVKSSAKDSIKKPVTPEVPVTPEDPVAAEGNNDNSDAASKSESGDEDEDEGEKWITLGCSIHLFDPETSTFIEQYAQAVAIVYDLGSFEYRLSVKTTDGEKALLALPIDSNMNPCFNYEHLSFIFNYFDGKGGAFSWLLRFASFEELELFQNEFMKALWEKGSGMRWGKATESEEDYLNRAFGEFGVGSSGTEGDTAPEDQDVDVDLDGDELEPDEENNDESRFTKFKSSLNQEDADFDEGYDVDEAKLSFSGKNTGLAVGTHNDRTYVVRGDKIGVFKQTDNDLEFANTIANVSTSKGQTFAPRKLMLHHQDEALILQNPDDLTKLLKLDLEYGKIVEEWQGDDYTKIESFAPNSKFAQRTAEQTIVGVSNNAVFKLDPRLSGDKLVQAETKRYAGKNDFRALTTTEQGHVAVASAKGDILLFNKLGIKAKARLPALGDEVIGIDASADGRWILATCKTYLLLIDTLIKSGKYEGEIGAVGGFSKDEKPRPKRLQISPEHVAYMQAETGKPLSFTKAHFNSGIDTKEQSIVTSTGPYVITWSLKKIKRGDASAYLIKRYSSQVTADQFQFGSDKNVIVALEDDVGMVNRRSFRKPTRETLATPIKRVKALSRNSIVDSPY